MWKWKHFIIITVAVEQWWCYWHHRKRGNEALDGVPTYGIKTSFLNIMFNMYWHPRYVWLCSRCGHTEREEGYHLSTSLTVSRWPQPPPGLLGWGRGRAGLGWWARRRSSRDPPSRAGSTGVGWQGSCYHFKSKPTPRNFHSASNTDGRNPLKQTETVATYWTEMSMSEASEPVTMLYGKGELGLLVRLAGLEMGDSARLFRRAQSNHEGP